jgi:hypothetical protein
MEPPSPLPDCRPPPFDWASVVTPRECRSEDWGAYKIYPISFAMPREDIVDCVPVKSQVGQLKITSH